MLHHRSRSLLFFSAAAAVPLLLNPAAHGQPAPCFPPEPTPGWTPFDVGTVSAGSSRPFAQFRDGYELCSASEGYTDLSDSFRFLFRLVRAHWEVGARLERLDPTGCAGLDARVHLGSSLLDDHPYVSIHVRRSAAGGLMLHSTFRREVGEKMDSGPAPLVVKLPIFLRIERTGSQIITSASEDGQRFTVHMRLDVEGTGLATQMFRAGMKQASEVKLLSTAVFSGAGSRIIEDRRPPVITRVEPNVGPVSGGTEVKISGFRLGETTEVLIGDLPAQILEVLDESVMVRTPKAEGPRSADVVVMTKSGGGGVLTSAFTQIGTPFIRADCNGDGKVDISDAVAKLGFLFLGSLPCQCFDALDANGDRRADLSDAVYTLGHLFLGSAAPPAPFPRPGTPLGPHIPCGLPPGPTALKLRLPAGQKALKEGDIFTIEGRGFPEDPSRIALFLGNTPAEVLKVTRSELTARVGMVALDISAARVDLLLDIGILVRSCKPTRCLFPIFVGDISANLFVDLIRSERVTPIGSSRMEDDVVVVPFDTSRIDPEETLGVMGRIILPSVAGGAGLSRGSQVLDVQLRAGGKTTPEQLGDEIAEAIRGQLTGGGDAREIDVAFDPQRRQIVFTLDARLNDFLIGSSLRPSFDISIYGLGRPPPCTCVADLDLDGIDESYTPLVDDRGYAWCRIYHLWKHCGGLPAWEYFFPRNCVYIESGSTCESDGSNTYPVFPLPAPHTIAPGVKSTMVNKSSYCHIRRHSLWNLCKLRDLELMGDLQVPHFPRDAVVVKTEWSTNPPGADSLYYSYGYDNGSTTTTQYLTGWHFTDKCIDNWTWCDLYMDSSSGGNGGCGGMNSDRPPALNGLGLDNYFMCVNVRITDPDTVCGNNFFPECNVANCMSCHHKDGDGGFSGADNGWSNSIGGGALGSDFLYSLTSGPAVPTGGPSDGDHPSCDN